MVHFNAGAILIFVIYIIIAKMLHSEPKASFACYECHQLHLRPKIRVPTESARRGHDVAIRDCNYIPFRSYGALAYLLRAHSRIINIGIYIYI